jgi:hypothetical protein
MSQYTKDLAAMNKTGNMEQPGAMPDKGVSTGLSGYDSMGMKTSIDATNSLGKLGDTKSDSAFESCPGDC